MVGPSYRKVVVFSNKFAYAFGQIILTGIAYGIKDWKYIEIAISVVPVLYFSFYWYENICFNALNLLFKTSRVQVIFS